MIVNNYNLPNNFQSWAIRRPHLGANKIAEALDIIENEFEHDLTQSQLYKIITTLNLLQTTLDSIAPKLTNNAGSSKDKVDSIADKILELKKSVRVEQNSIQAAHNKVKNVRLCRPTGSEVPNESKSTKHVTFDLDASEELKIAEEEELNILLQEIEQLEIDVEELEIADQIAALNNFQAEISILEQELQQSPSQLIPQETPAEDNVDLEKTPIINSFALAKEKQSPILDTSSIDSSQNNAALTSFTRKYPTRSINETMKGKGEYKTKLKKTEQCFYKDEIIQVHQGYPTQKITGRLLHGHTGTIDANRSEHDKWVVQQVGARGCTAAASAMLILDNGGQVNVFRFKHTDLGTNESMCTAIEGAGLKPRRTDLKSFDDLKPLIDQFGSAIVSVDDPDIEGHVIVVDEIKGNHARVRDPFHGWEITVKLKALKKRMWGLGEIIQIQK